MASFVTLDFAKSYLGIATSTGDAQLQAFLDTACQVASDFCQRRFLSQNYTEIHSGNNTPNLLLRQTPVTNLASLYLDGGAYFGTSPDPFNATTLLVSGVDYFVRWDGVLGGDNEDSSDQTQASMCGIVQRIASVWPGRLAYIPGQLINQLVPGAGNIKVSYTAGYSIETIPMTLRAAVCNIAKVLSRSAPFGGLLGSESWQGYSYSLLNSAEMGRQYPPLGSAKQMLLKFRRYA